MRAFQRPYIPTLDGWRAIAILLVMAHHDFLHQIGAFSTFWIYHRGAVGVDIFFAISGVLICTLMLDEEEQTGSFSVKEFYARRAFRILPASCVYLFCIAVMHSMEAFPQAWKIDWLGSLFFFRSFLFFDQGDWYTAHFWSLSIEEHFYFFLPAFIVICTRFRARLLMGIGLAIAIAGAVVLKLQILPGHADLSDIRLGALFLAAGTAVLLRKTDVRQRAAQLLHPLVTITLAIVAVRLIHSGSILLLIIPFLMLAAVMSTVLRPGAAISRILESGPLKFIGKRSYSLYLWQQLFMCGHFPPRTGFAAQGWPWNWLCSFLMACLSYSIVEQPMIRLGRSLLERKNKISTTEVAEVV